MESDARTAVRTRGTTIVVAEFDGMHLGHRRLVEAAAQVARRTRSPLIGVVLDAAHQELQLLAMTRRLEELLRAGCDSAVVIDTTTLDDASGVLLAERIVSGTNATQAVFACRPMPGAPRAPTSIRAGFAACGIDLIEVERVADSYGTAVTSAGIRDAIKRGDVELAAEHLGVAYAIRGIVRRGAQLGRQMGFPTANLNPPDDLVVPLNGVYAGTVLTPDGTSRPAAVNIGVRPTVETQQRTLIEAHILDFAADIYDDTIEVRFRRRLRAERRFDSIDALTAQLRHDVQAVAAEST